MKYFFLFFFLPFIGKTQVLNNSEGQAFTDKPFFNKTFIQVNKIKSIDGLFNYKKSGEAMYATKFHYVYEFDREGNLVASFETRTDDGTSDTTWNKYMYDSQNRLAIHKRGDAKGLTAIHFTYDDKNRIIKEEYWKEPIDSLGVPMKPILQNVETMRYDRYNGQEKKTIYNSYDLPYRVEVSYINEQGYLTSREERLMMTSDVGEYVYSYTPKGFIESIKMFKGKNEIPVEELKFKYDEFGNVTEKLLYREGNYITETAILYNSKSNLMSSVLIRDVKTNFIMAIRFLEYEYYE